MSSTEKNEKKQKVLEKAGEGLCFLHAMCFLQPVIQVLRITAAVTWLALVTVQQLSRICFMSPGTRGNKCPSWFWLVEESWATPLSF